MMDTEKEFDEWYHKPIDVEEIEKEVEDFNKKFKPGDKVKIESDLGDVHEVTISHPATILSKHTAVGWFEEIGGCYLLSRVIQ